MHSRIKHISMCVCLCVYVCVWQSTDWSLSESWAFEFLKGTKEAQFLHQSKG